MLRSACLRCARRLYSSKAIETPHKALTYIPAFLSANEQKLLLRHSLKLLSAPARTSSTARKRMREWRRAHKEYDESTFASDEAYEWEESHFDGVIQHYREMLVRPGHWPDSDPELIRVLQRVYSLLPAASPSEASKPSTSQQDPPDHLLLHLLHLASNGEIRAHVDNREASGGVIVGVSLGSERIVRFIKSEDPPSEEAADGPDRFDWLLEPGSIYIQKEPLRSYYTHEIPALGEWQGRQVGGRQRLSLMLRDKLPSPST